MITRLEHLFLSYEDRLRELGPYTLQKRRFWGHLRGATRRLERDYRTRGTGFKMKQGRFRLGIREKLFYKGNEALAHIAQGDFQFPIPGSVQDQPRWHLE